MMQNNLISATIADADKLAVAQSLTDIKTKLANVLIISLTPDERKSTLKMGDKTMAFVQKALDYANQNPSLVPAFLDVAEANKDYSLTHDLYAILQQMYALTTSMEDALMVAGSEAYDAALIFYNAVKGAVRSNVPGSQSIVDDLSAQFPARGSKTAPVAQPTA